MNFRIPPISRKNTKASCFTTGFLFCGDCELSAHHINPCKGILAHFYYITLGKWVGSQYTD